MGFWQWLISTCAWLLGIADCSKKSAFVRLRLFIASLHLENMAIGLTSYSHTRTLGRKRVLVSNNFESSSQAPPLKRICSDRISQISERFPLEVLPWDILVHVLCCVDHDDLKQLILVSKAIKEATLIAKEWHFEYSTPKKKSFTFQNPFSMEDANRFQEIEAPNAPLRKSRSRFNEKKLASISVALFASMDEE
ncbi:hypothetical protein VNO77_22063 [Canavalia gladiata]|uniref:F-box domain-containing protein n=1 Tax=Canavalia gladiata TaxID=3824 RepID=A0AAN9L5E2_CANGL